MLNIFNDRYFSHYQGIVHRWHEHTQIFLASISVIHEQQFIAFDDVYNNYTVSNELKDILDQARALLCDIEHFVNATSNRNNKSKPYWYEKEEMGKIVKFSVEKRTVNNKFVKARFQNYIDKLYKRIKHFNLEKNLKSLRHRPRTTLGAHRNRKNKSGKNRGVGNQKRLWRTTANGKSTTIEKTFIITTKRPRRNKTNKTMPRQRKNNNINQSLN